MSLVECGNACCKMPVPWQLDTTNSTCNNMNTSQLVAVAMSGGVDSSIAALLFEKAGNLQDFITAPLN